MFTYYELKNCKEFPNYLILFCYKYVINIRAAYYKN